MRESVSEERELLIRIDERLSSLEAKFDKLETMTGAWYTRCITCPRESFVAREELRPVKALVYGATSLMLIAFMGALISLVISNANTNNVNAAQAAQVQSNQSGGGKVQP